MSKPLSRKLICDGCQRTLVPGDRYIEDTASRFAGAEPNPEIDDLIADILGNNKDEGVSTIIFCEDCTDSGGRWQLKTVE